MWQESFGIKNICRGKLHFYWLFRLLASIYKGNIPLTRLIGLIFTKEILPPTNLLNSNGSWTYEASRWRNNWSFDGVVTSPHFEKLGHRVIKAQIWISLKSSRLSFIKSIVTLYFCMRGLIIFNYSGWWVWWGFHHCWEWLRWERGWGRKSVIWTFFLFFVYWFFLLLERTPCRKYFTVLWIKYFHKPKKLPTPQKWWWWMIEFNIYILYLHIICPKNSLIQISCQSIKIQIA